MALVGTFGRGWEDEVVGLEGGEPDMGRIVGVVLVRTEVDHLIVGGIVIFLEVECGGREAEAFLVVGLILSY